MQRQLDSISAELFYENYKQTQTGFVKDLQADSQTCQRAASSISTSGDSAPVFTPASSGHLSPLIPHITVQDLSSPSLSLLN